MKSLFSQKLDTDPALRKRYKKVVQDIREAVREEVKACERAEQFTAKDFRIIINARTEDMFR